MTYRVVTLPSAERDIEQAANWIAQDSPRGARIWIEGLERAISFLSALPERCPLAPEAGAFEEEIRQLLYGRRRSRYRVLFRIRGNTVEILHVRHAARRPLEP